MNIFTFTLIAHYIFPFLAAIGILVLIYLAFVVANYGRSVVYQAGMDWLALRSGYNNQEIDKQQRQSAIELDKQQRQLALAAPKRSLIEWANWYVAHQYDVEIDVLSDGKQDSA